MCCALIFASTFIPKGAFAFNPQALGSVGGTPETGSSHEDEENAGGKIKESSFTEKGGDGDDVIARRKDSTAKEPGGGLVDMLSVDAGK